MEINWTLDLGALISIFIIGINYVNIFNAYNDCFFA